MQPRNYPRRILGGAICLSPLVFAIVAACWSTPASPTRHALAVGLIAAAGLIAVLNFYLSLIRRSLWQRRHRPGEEYRHVSGLPVLGTMLQVAGCAVGFGSLSVGLGGLAAALLDTGGLPWFAVATWTDQSFWDGRSPAQAERPADGETR